MGAPSKGTAQKRFHFLHHDIDAMPLRANDTSAFVSSLLAGNYRLTLGGAATGNGSLDFGGNGILAADLISMEILLRLNSIDVNSTICIGMASAFNADPDVVAEAAWFKIIGAAGTNAHTMSVESDDGTTNIDDEPTAKTLPIGQFCRLGIDFKLGQQTISPPATSKGGLGSLVFSGPRITVGESFLSPIKLTQHMDISAIGATVALQPMILGVQATTTGTTVLDVREIVLEYVTH